MRMRYIVICALTLLVSGCNEEEQQKLSLAFIESAQAPDPVVQDVPLLYVERSLTLADSSQQVTRRANTLDVFEPGARLMLKDRAQPSAPAVNLLEIFAVDGEERLFDVRDLQPDSQGERVVFSLRGPFDPDADEDEQPSWNIWIYDRMKDEMSRVISSDTIAEAGHDRDPAFLPDGRIVFTSTRQRRARAILLDEGRPQFAALDEDRNEPAFVLHVMSSNGEDIEQITFNQSHDQDPTVLSSGEIVFSRWDNVPGRNAVSLYRINPDGTRQDRLYGYHSVNAGRGDTNIAFLEPQELSPGRLLTLATRTNGNTLSVDPLVIDVDGYIDNEVPVFANAGATGPAQVPIAAGANPFAGVSAGGRFAAIWPFRDGSSRMLAAWSPCRLQQAGTAGNNIVPCDSATLQATDPAPLEAAPIFGLWIFDSVAGTQQPVVPAVEGTAITEAVMLTAGTPAYFIPPAELDDAGRQLAAEGAGLLHIHSVFDLDGADASPSGLLTTANPSLTSLAARTAAFVRLVKPVSIPGDEVVDLPGTAFGRSQGELMREIIGYAPVHPDGSVLVKVPANVPFAISVLDPDGRRISPRHRNWISVRPGETLSCTGCHTGNSTAPHGRRDAVAPSINPGGPYAGLNPDYLVNPGETMAVAFARAAAAPAPALSPRFDDLWTDASQRTPDPAFDTPYTDLVTPAPVSSACLNEWQANCRITIHYPTHIHPLWEVDRQLLDADGSSVLADNTCTSCHSPTDAMGAAQVPAGQLDLGGGPSSDQPDHVTSYRELLFGDNEQEVVNGALVDRLVPVLDNNGNPVFQTDENGDLLLDAADNPIPVLRTVGVAPAMSVGGANASNRFFSRFSAGGTHAGFLGNTELRLISEWLDIGGQYYNDPFEVPR